MGFLTFDVARELAKAHGTPLLVLSQEKLRCNIADLRSCLPQVRFHYAVKANPHNAIVRLVHQEGLGFDVSSPGEISRVLSLGVSQEDLLYTKPVNKESELRYARDAGVTWFVIDNPFEVDKLSRCAPGSNILVRLRVSTKDAVVDLSYKFGAAPNEALHLIQKVHNAGLSIRGLSFHVGSQCTNPYSFVETIATCRVIFNQAAANGLLLDTLDIGGGFPVTYLEPVAPIEQFCDPIAAALDRYFGTYQIIAEPGRFLVGDAVTLIVQVIGKSIRAGIKWYYVDDGLYGSFSGKLYDKCDYPVVAEQDDKKELCVLAGPTCDSFDVLYANRALPELDIGDILLVDGMGAYTNASASDFNCLPKAEVVVI